MKIKIGVALLFLLLLIMTSVVQAGAEPSSSIAREGSLDLTGWDFQEKGPVWLNGDWEFYWNRLLDPAAFQQESSLSKTGYITEPQSWNKYVVNGSPLPAYGYATYRLTVNVDSDKEVWALYIPTMSTAYNLWVNGELVAHNGKVGTSRETMIPQFLPQNAHFRAADNRIEIVIEVSNFFHRRGGFWKGVELGTAAQMESQLRKRVGGEMFLIGSVCMIGFYHLSYFFFRRKDRSNLYFGLLCFCIGAHAINVGENVLIQAFPRFSWEWGLKLEYLGYYLGVPLFVLLLRCLFPDEIRPAVVRFSIGAGGLFSLLVLVTQGSWYSHTWPAYNFISMAILARLVYALVLACLRKREGALVIATASGLLALTVLNDVFYYSEWFIGQNDTATVGMFIFILFQSFVLSKKVSKAYTSVEQLGEKLSEMNNQLDVKVQERTSAFEIANRDLRFAEESRRRLLQNITHDLKTPITSIRANLEAVLDGVVEPQQVGEHLHIIHRRTMGMNRLIDDLFELSKLETRQINFKNEDIPLTEFLDFLYRKYELDMQSSGIKFEIQNYATAADLMMHVDHDRLDQIFANLLTNSMKNTPKGGAVRVTAAVDGAGIGQQLGAIRFEVQDSGFGIAEDDLPYIFDRFYKNDKSRHRSLESHGLGLSIVKEIVANYGGDIQVRSVQNERTVVSFTLWIGRAAS